MNPDNETVQDDVRAAITSLEATSEGGVAAPAASPAAAPADVPAAAPAQAPVASDDDGTAAGGPKRDASGRFAPASATKEGEAAAPVPAVAAAPASAAAPPAPTATERGEVVLDPTKPPQGWTAPMKEKWAALPEDVRNEVTRREQDMAAGVQRLNQQYEPLRQLGQSLQSFDPYFEHIKRPPSDYLKELIPIEQTLALGNPAQKLDMLLSVADRYGVPIRNVLDQAMGGKLKDTLAESHQQFGSPTPLPPAIQQELTTLRSQIDGIQSMAAKNELDAFMADTEAHPFFQQVSPAMTQLLESGAAVTYQDAYDIAVWRNPDMRAQVVAQANGRAQQAGIQQRQAAAAVAVPPSSASLAAPSPATAGDGDVYDDVRRAWTAAAQSNRA